jgi:hypothetical protein
MRCPGCERGAALDHSIDSQGVVKPSVVCPYDDCTFHAFVTLEGWSDEAE